MAKKVKNYCEKKVFPRIHMDTDILQKTEFKLAIFSLYGPIYNLPLPYRWSPPCANKVVEVVTKLLLDHCTE